jgi:predicted HTH transcriptional regulator
MNQMAIDFEQAHARRTDPETSKTAARNAEKFSESHAGRILLALQQHGPRTPKELEQIVGLSVVQIDRRLPDLKKLRLARVVKLDDGAEASRGGCRVWEAVQ